MHYFPILVCPEHNKSSSQICFILCVLNSSYTKDLIYDITKIIELIHLHGKLPSTNIDYKFHNFPVCTVLSTKQIIKNTVDPVGFGRISRFIFNRDSRAKRKHRITFDIQNVSF